MDEPAAAAVAALTAVSVPMARSLLSGCVRLGAARADQHDPEQEPRHSMGHHVGHPRRLLWNAPDFP